MRHPQDDLLIVYALIEFAREHKGTCVENHAQELATEIADQHGLTPIEVAKQLEERGRANCWEEDCR
ncbi:hypothetical protein [Halopiger goleimassiliensis]|uniref:hypothetical protein n=1 Tax=Halopiger goleimassiliensis TaxID=1293048 RepID=UPI00067831E5|nr:hypothetical protein [Halopiger goleimassiliensis]